MPNGVTCPNCQTELDLSGLPEVPPSVRCGQCSTVFSTVEAQTKSRWRGDDQVGSQAGTQTDLLPPGVPAAPTQATPGQPGSGQHPDLPPGNLIPPSAPQPGTPPLPGSPHPGTPQNPAAHNPASHGTGAQAGFDPTPPHLQSGASSTHASGGIQLQVDENDSPHRRRAKGGGFSATWLVIGATGLIAIGAIVIAIVYMQRGPFQIAAREADDLPTNRSDDDNGAAGEIRWTDASRYSARISSVKVKVERIEFGEVRARNEQREVQTSQDDSFFQLYLVVENQRRLPVDYTSWYGNEFEVDGKTLVAQLSDLEGNVFPMLVFRDAFDIHGHTPNASLNEKIEIRDTIVFEIPEEVDIAKVSAFRLTLPAAAFGELGSLHFEIPEAMIKKAQSGSGLLNSDAPLGNGTLDEPEGDPGSDDSEPDGAALDGAALEVADSDSPTGGHISSANAVVSRLTFNQAGKRANSVSDSGRQNSTGGRAG